MNVSQHYAESGKCETCNGCFVDGCEAKCHGPHEGDPELERLLAEEEALEAAKADLTRIAEAAWVRMNREHGAQSDETKRRFMRFFESGYGERYVTDAAYWMLNYAQAAQVRASQEDRIQELEQALMREKIKVAEHELSDMRRTLAYMEDPYGRF